MLSRSTALRCFFASKPPPSPQPLLDLAHSRSGDGLCVYRSRAAVVEVLDAVAATGPVWWTDECAKFVEDVRASPAGRSLLSQPSAAAGDAAARPPIVLAEGLDGVGKTTVTKNLADKLGGVLVRTPDPELDPVRGRFRVAEEVLARAFYAGANYLAAEHIADMVVKQNKAVVIDRWWASTAAMAIANVTDEAAAADALAKVGAWPEDLPRYDLGVLLDVGEDVRLKRMAGRGDTNVEEAKLAQDRHLRKRAMAAYKALGPRPLEPTIVHTYMIAVNCIIDRLARMEAANGADPATDLEVSAAGRRILLPEGLAKTKFTMRQQLECKPW